MPKRGRRVPVSWNKPATQPKSDDDSETIPGQELLDGLYRLRHDPKYSDLTIKCGSTSYAVHRCIVCPRSDFFSGTCDGRFKEASDHVVELNEDPALVAQMVEYLYTLDYQVNSHLSLSKPAPDEPSTLERLVSKLNNREDEDGTPQENQTGTYTLDHDIPPVESPAVDPLSFHILMYSLADRMLIKGLKHLSQRKVECEMNEQLEQGPFRRAICEIFNSTPLHDRGLRDLAVKITMNHLRTLWKAEDRASAAFEDDLIDTVPQFSQDLLVALIKKDVSNTHDFFDRGLY